MSSPQWRISFRMQVTILPDTSDAPHLQNISHFLTRGFIFLNFISQIHRVTGLLLSGSEVSGSEVRSQYYFLRTGPHFTPLDNAHEYRPLSEQ